MEDKEQREEETHPALQLRGLFGVFGLQSFRQFGVKRRSRLLLPALLVLHLDTHSKSVASLQPPHSQNYL